MLRVFISLSLSLSVGCSERGWGGSGGTAAERRCISGVLDVAVLTDIISPVCLLSVSCQSISSPNFCRLLTGFAETGL